MGSYIEAFSQEASTVQCCVLCLSYEENYILFFADCGVMSCENNNVLSMALCLVGKV